MLDGIDSSGEPLYARGIPLPDAYQLSTFRPITSTNVGDFALAPTRAITLTPTHLAFTSSQIATKTGSNIRTSRGMYVALQRLQLYIFSSSADTVSQPEVPSFFPPSDASELMTCTPHAPFNTIARLEVRADDGHHTVSRRHQAQFIRYFRTTDSRPWEMINLQLECRLNHVAHATDIFGVVRHYYEESIGNRLSEKQLLDQGLVLRCTSSTPNGYSRQPVPPLTILLQFSRATLDIFVAVALE